VWAFSSTDSGAAGAFNYHVVSPRYIGPVIVHTIAVEWNPTTGALAGLPNIMLWESDDSNLPGARTATTIFPTGICFWDQSWNSANGLAAPLRQGLASSRGEGVANIAQPIPVRYLIRTPEVFLKFTAHHPGANLGDCAGWVALFEAVPEESLVALLAG